MELYNTVQEIHAELEEWRLDSPNLNVTKMKPAEREYLIGFASIGLHFVYHNALIMIHRVPVFLNYIITARGESKKLESVTKAHASKSTAIGAQAARDTLKIVNNMPWGDIAWTWYVQRSSLSLSIHINLIAHS